MEALRQIMPRPAQSVRNGCRPVAHEDLAEKLPLVRRSETVEAEVDEGGWSASFR